MIEVVKRSDDQAGCKVLPRIADLDEILGDLVAEIEFEDDPEEGWHVKTPELAA